MAVISFLIGMVLGGAFGVAVAAVMGANKEDDERELREQIEYLDEWSRRKGKKQERPEK